MKKSLAILWLTVLSLLDCVALGQMVLSGSAVLSGQAVSGQGSGGNAYLPAMPAIWVDNNELTCGITSSCSAGSPGLSLTPPAYALTLSSGGGTWSPSAPCSLGTSRYTNNGTGLQNAFTDLEGCRTSAGVGFILKVPPGTYSLTNGFTIPQTSSVLAEAPIIVESTYDSTLAAMGPVACAGLGIQDNILESIAPGLNNPDCTGTNMYFATGPYQSSGAIEGITTVSVNTTGLFNVTASASPQLIWLTNDYVSPTLAPTDGSGECPSGEISIDTGASQECVTPASLGNTVVTDGSMAATSAVLTTASSNPFQPWMVGFNITVSGAGNAACTSALSTGIASYQNSGQVTLTTASKCTSTDSGATVTIQGNQIGLYAVFTKSHTAPFCVLYNVTAAEVALTGNTACSGITDGSGAITLADGTNTNVSAYNYLQYMYQIQSTGNTAPLAFCTPVAGTSFPCGGTTQIGADHWEFLDAAISLNPGNTSDTDIIIVGDTLKATSITQYDSHLHFRRVWAHGDWTSLAAGYNKVSTAFDLKLCYYCSVVGTQVSQALRPGGEGHSITPHGQAIKIVDSWLEGSSTCIFSGGVTNNPQILPIGSFVFGQDLQIGRVRCTFPYPWLGMGGVPLGHWMNQSVVRKNGEEMKSGQRIVFYGSIIENSDNSGGQAGIVAAYTTTNWATATLGQYYQGTLSDLFFQDLIFRNACQDISWRGSSYNGANGGGVSSPSQRIVLSNALHYGISHSNPLCVSGDPGMTIMAGQQTWTGTVTENSAGTQATFVATASVDAGAPMESDTIAAATSSGTTATVTAANGFISGESIEFLNTGTCLDGQSASVTATGNPFTATSTTSCSASASTGTVQGPAGYQVFNIPTGNAVSVTLCTNTAFNVPTRHISGIYEPLGLGPLASSGSAAWTGTWSPANVTVTYPWVATPNSSDTSGTCTLVNSQGVPSPMMVTHQDFITDRASPMGSGPTGNNPTFLLNFLFRDSIALSVGAAGNAGFYNHYTPVSPNEGTNTEVFDYDAGSSGTGGVGTSTLDYLVWPGRSSSYYTGYGNNPNYPDANPTPTLYFPVAPYCTGSTYVGSSGMGSAPYCVAFVGAMSTSSMPITLPDYHSFELRSDSPFHNGASDGTDIGTNIPALDAAQTATQYHCSPPYSCNGFPD